MYSCRCQARGRCTICTIRTINSFHTRPRVPWSPSTRRFRGHGGSFGSLAQFERSGGHGRHPRHDILRRGTAGTGFKIVAKIHSTRPTRPTRPQFRFPGRVGRFFATPRKNYHRLQKISACPRANRSRRSGWWEGRIWWAGGGCGEWRAVRCCPARRPKSASQTNTYWGELWAWRNR